MDRGALWATIHRVQRIVHDWALTNAFFKMYVCDTELVKQTEFIRRKYGTSQVAQWLRICLPGLPWWLSGKEPAWQCRRLGFDPWSVNWSGRSHSSESRWTCVPSLLSLCYRVQEPQLLKPASLQPVLHNKRSHCNEKSVHWPRQ